MNRAIVLPLLLIVVACSLAGAQTPQSNANPVVSTIRALEERQSKNLIAAAEEMPADKYSYQPTPEQMSFAHLVIHVAESNNRLCSVLAGEKQEVAFDGKEPKDALVRALNDSFSFCKKALDKASDANLGEPADLPGGRTGTRATALITLATGWADHYSAAAMYLRLNNLLPPTAKPKSK